MADPDTSLPPAAVVVTLNVADFETWKTSFDGVEGFRVEAGFLGHHLNRSQDDPNRVAIYLASGDPEKGRAFAQSPELAEIMRKAGVQGPPEFLWVAPKRVAVIWDRQLPAMIVRHTVADFDTWLDGYDAADDLRSANGIVGHAADQLLDAPNEAMVYHQAESFDALHAFLEMPELQAAMKEAGVTSEPEVTFHTSGWGKLY